MIDQEIACRQLWIHALRIAVDDLGASRPKDEKIGRDGLKCRNRAGISRWQKDIYSAFRYIFSGISEFDQKIQHSDMEPEYVRKLCLERIKEGTGKWRMARKNLCKYVDTGGEIAPDIRESLYRYVKSLEV